MLEAFDTTREMVTTDDSKEPTSFTATPTHEWKNFEKIKIFLLNFGIQSIENKSFSA